MTQVTLLIQIVVQIAFPVLLGWWLTRRFGGDKVDTLRIFLGGMIGYAVAQAVLLALSQLVSSADLSGIAGQTPAMLSALGFGAAVGVLEELARFAVLRLWLRDVRSWGHGLIFGAGHGGAEGIFTGLVGAIWYMTMQSLRSGPPVGEQLSATDQASLDQVVSAYWSTPWQTPLLSALQQVFLIILSLGLATLVMRAFLTGRLIYLPAAMIVHSVATASAVYLGQVSASLSLVVSGAFAVLGILIVVRYAEPPPPLPAAPEAPSQASAGAADSKTPARARRKRTRKS